MANADKWEQLSLFTMEEQKNMEVVNERTWFLIKLELAMEAARVKRFSSAAHREGRRSRAKINTKRIGLKYGVPYHGYSRLDIEAGNAILATLKM